MGWLGRLGGVQKNVTGPKNRDVAKFRRLVLQAQKEFETFLGHFLYLRDELFTLRMVLAVRMQSKRVKGSLSPKIKHLATYLGAALCKPSRVDQCLLRN